MHGVRDIFELISHGGFMMAPLLISGLIALTVILERFYIFKKRFSTPRQFTFDILKQVRAGDLTLAEQACRSRPTPVTSVLASGIEHFGNPPEEMELAMRNQAEEWMPILERRVEILDTVITAAPLMGLLGTITGMMGSFKVLSEKGVNEPNAITGGVAEALIATATGLVIALICLVAYNYLSARIKSFIYEVESAASKLMEAKMSTQRKER